MSNKQEAPRLARIGTARVLTQGSMFGTAKEADGIRFYNP